MTSIASLLSPLLLSMEMIGAASLLSSLASTSLLLSSTLLLEVEFAEVELSEVVFAVPLPCLSYFLELRGVVVPLDFVCDLVYFFVSFVEVLVLLLPESVLFFLDPFAVELLPLDVELLPLDSFPDELLPLEPFPDEVLLVVPFPSVLLELVLLEFEPFFELKDLPRWTPSRPVSSLLRKGFLPAIVTARRTSSNRTFFSIILKCIYKY